MTDSPIMTFLKALQAVKGPQGKLELRLERQSQIHSAIQGGARCLGNPGALNLAPPPDTLILQPDGRLHVGDAIELVGKTPINGWLFLFNLGTSGACTRLFPNPDCPDNYFHAGDVFRLPSNRILPNSCFEGGIWREVGPTTAETGECERILAILSREKNGLNVEDLHAGFARKYATMRSAGFGGAVQVDTSQLFTLSPDVWEYQLVAAEVCT